jgi:conjugative relaxase-like TrwC/TraI family protein
MGPLVLSIGKLAAGQAGYYLDQAQGTITRARAVASGVEDYYLGGHEAKGRWAASGAAALGLRGEVGDEPLLRVLVGEHPATGDPLGRVLGTRRPGFDLTFSAPKSVSVLLGVGDDGLRSVLQAAHDEAVADALAYVERHAAVTRRGPAGVYTIPGNGLVAATFRHRTSRAGDPQLHTHVLVANLTLGADGRWSTLDARRIYAHAKTAGFLYESRLRGILTRELGVEWAPVRHGIAEIEGVPSQVLRAFSRRRADIEAELERRGASGAAAAQVATLATRRGKDYRVTPEQLVPEWRERARSLGLTRETIAGLAHRTRTAQLSAAELDRILEDLAGADGVTRDRSTFTRRDVLQALSERLPARADLTAQNLEGLADAFLTSPRAVVLAEGSPRTLLRRTDGRLIPLARTERTYSTLELLTLEQRILDHAVEGQAAVLGLARPHALERSLRRRPSLTTEQAEMVRHLTSDGRGIAVVVGPAGAGKTHALDAAREAWEASGARVLGAALARRAARELEDGAGIPSTSVAALLDRLDRNPRRVLGRRGVLVLDEAAMIPTRELAALVEHARACEAKLVLLGDDRQLPAIGAGGAFRGLLSRVPVIELQENRRQLAGWERDALQALRDGDVRAAVDRYAKADRIVVGERPDELRRALVSDWWAAGDPAGAVMIAQRRVDVADLNGRAHALMRAAGGLGEEELVVGGIAFSVGDHVLVRRNDRRLGVVNGDRGVVTRVEPETGGIELDLGGRRAALPREYLEQPTRHGGRSLMHGYAMTVHLAQGMTCRQTFVLVGDQLTREAGYVALSRGRESNRLYLLDGPASDRDEYAREGAAGPDPLRALVDTLRRSRAQTLATDTPGELASLEQRRAELVHERDAAARSRAGFAREHPPWFRPSARARRADGLERATALEERAAERLDALERRAEVLRQEQEPDVARLRARRLGRGLER